MREVAVNPRRSGLGMHSRVRDRPPNCQFLPDGVPRRGLGHRHLVLAVGGVGGEHLYNT